MRYADGGGLTMEGRSRREQVRLQAAGMFEHGEDAGQIASSLRVSTKSVYQWRRAWQAGGEGALASKGAGGNPCKLDEEQIAQLRAALDAGPAAYGWEQDQRWTLARVAALVMRLFGVSYTLRGVSFLLHRLGFSPQVPAHRAVRAGRGRGRGLAARRPGRRYEARGADRRVDLLRGRSRAGTAGRHKARTWAPRGHTPVVRVSGNSRAPVGRRAWPASSPAGRAGSSTGSASTAGARANARACPKPTTRT